MRLERWLQEVLETPGLTAIREPDEAWSMLVADAFRGVGTVRELEGRIVDVGSGNGSPGIPLAASLPEREVTLLESSRRKCEFLERLRPATFRTCASSAGVPRSKRPTLRGRDREGSRLASGRARMGPAARSSRRCGGALAGPLGRSRAAGEGLRAARRRPSGEPERPRRRARDRADSRGFSASPGSSPETSSRLITMEGCPGASTPSPTRRVASANYDCREPCGLPRAGRGTRAARRSRPPGECDLGARRAGERSVDAICSTARRPPSGEPTRFANLDLIRRSRISPGRPPISRGAGTGSASSRRRSLQPPSHTRLSLWTARRRSGR